MTGRAVSQFGHTGAQLQSSVQVFATHAHAVGDFTVDTREGTARCEGEQLRKAIGQGAQLLSSRQIQAPKVGERAIAFRWVIKVGVSTIYLDAIEFVRGRAVAGVFALNVGRVLTGLDALARSMDVRLQPSVA